VNDKLSKYLSPSNYLWGAARRLNDLGFGGLANAIYTQLGAKDQHTLARYRLTAEGDAEGLNKLASAIDFTVFSDMRPTPFHDLTPLERRIYLEVFQITAQMPEAMAQLCRSVRYVIDSGIAGDFVECGVYKGSSIIAIIRTLQDLGVTNRRIWLFDTFQGMTEPEPVDRFYSEDETAARRDWEERKLADGGSEWVRAPLDEVRDRVLATGYPKEMLSFVKGPVEETIPGTMPEQIALLRLDTDFYRSTKHELVHLYPRLSPGGPLIIDDYGAYDGCRLATDEYFQEQGMNVLLARIDEHVRMLVKSPRG
jgi:hypothetical protein